MKTMPLFPETLIFAPQNLTESDNKLHKDICTCKGIHIYPTNFTL